MDTCYQKIQRPSERNLLIDGSRINCTGKRLALVNCRPLTYTNNSLFINPKTKTKWKTKSGKHLISS